MPPRFAGLDRFWTKGDAGLGLLAKRGDAEYCPAVVDRFRASESGQKLGDFVDETKRGVRYGRGAVRPPCNMAFGGKVGGKVRVYMFTAWVWT